MADRSDNCLKDNIADFLLLEIIAQAERKSVTVKSAVFGYGPIIAEDLEIIGHDKNEAGIDFVVVAIRIFILVFKFQRSAIIDKAHLKVLLV